MMPITTHSVESIPVFYDLDMAKEFIDENGFVAFYLKDTHASDALHTKMLGLARNSEANRGDRRVCVNSWRNCLPRQDGIW